MPAPSSFEEALQKLEEIVRNLEQGELHLDDALAAFAEGVELVRYGRRCLGEAEQRLQLLSASLDGAWRVEELEPEKPPAGED